MKGAVRILGYFIFPWVQSVSCFGVRVWLRAYSVRGRPYLPATKFWNVCHKSILVGCCVVFFPEKWVIKQKTLLLYSFHSQQTKGHQRVRYYVCICACYSEGKNTSVQGRLLLCGLHFYISFGVHSREQELVRASIVIRISFHVLLFHLYSNVPLCTSPFSPPTSSQRLVVKDLVWLEKSSDCNRNFFKRTTK